jgi:ribosomal protein S18 acetylase RimI-like enzyme
MRFTWDRAAGMSSIALQSDGAPSHVLPTVRIAAPAAPFDDALRTALVVLLTDAIDDNASVGFLAPLSGDDASAYWASIEQSVAAGRCTLLIAADDDDAIVGTAQLDTATMPNQPHRATVSKLLVHTDARRRGIALALMAELEAAAAAQGRWLLTLDTATDGAARLYERMGWTRAGTIPDYALNADGSLTDTAYYWKRLPRS